MTVFKAFLSILKKNRMVVFLYVVILVFFGTFNFKTESQTFNFEATKPKVFIINEDKGLLSQDLEQYLKERCTFVSLDEQKVDDALFYRDIHYFIRIPASFEKEEGLVFVKSNGNYEASLAKMYLERYLNLYTIYKAYPLSNEEIIKKIHTSLDSEVSIDVLTKLDTNGLNNAASFYNMANYTFLAGCVFVICLIISSFKTEKINKRTLVSSMNYKKFNRLLLLSNGLFAVFLWGVYLLLSFLLVGEIMFTIYGLLYILNSFIFMILSLALAVLLSTLVRNKEAINGIVNVIALGSSFLCGAFVPMDFLPESVVKFSHILPSYYYIKNNELIKSLEVIDFSHMKPILINVSLLICFILLFVVVNNVVSKRKQKTI
mgnify:CR=1 FL=1